MHGTSARSLDDRILSLRLPPSGVDTIPNPLGSNDVGFNSWFGRQELVCLWSTELLRGQNMCSRGGSSTCGTHQSGGRWFTPLELDPHYLAAGPNDNLLHLNVGCVVQKSVDIYANVTQNLTVAAFGCCCSLDIKLASSVFHVMLTIPRIVSDLVTCRWGNDTV